MKRGIFYIAIPLILVGLLIPLVSSEIYIDQLNSVYNVGDVVTANVKLSSPIDTTGFFSSYLICGVNELETYKSMVILKANEENEVSVISFVEDGIVGTGSECFIRALFNSGEARSQSFKISRKAIIGMNVDSAVLTPGDTLKIEGTVVKENRESLTGNIEINIEGLDVRIPDSLNIIGEEFKEESNETVVSNGTEESIEDSEESAESSEEETVIKGTLDESAQENKIINIGSIFSEVINGSFSISLQIPEDAPPGTYSVNAKAYDSDKGRVLNEGEASTTIRVKQVIKSVELAFKANTITPDNSFYFIPIIYDQAGNYGEGEVDLTILRPDKNVYENKLVKASETNSIFIAANYTPGFWEISAKFNGLEKKRIFFVEEFIKLYSNLEDGMLVIRNIGNVPYKGPVEISIGNKSEVKNINLDYGESIKFNLEAPDGEYSIKVYDGKNATILGKTFLTGNAIGVSEAGNFFLGNLWVWLWTLLIVILLGVILIIVRKIMKKRFVGKAPKVITTMKKEPYQSSIAPKPLLKEQPIAGFDSVMSSGSKSDAVIIALKIKNLQSLKQSPAYENPLNAIDKALSTAKEAKSKIYVDDDYRIIIFSKEISKDQDLELKTIVVAKKIEKMINEYNKLSKLKIDFGIGVHIGQLAIETKDGKTKFISLGNTISISKRIAEHSSAQVLLSDPLHKKTLGKLRVEKFKDTGFWQVNKIIDRDAHEDFIDRFLQRQKTQNNLKSKHI